MAKWTRIKVCLNSYIAYQVWSKLVKLSESYSKMFQQIDTECQEDFPLLIFCTDQTWLSRNWVFTAVHGFACHHHHPKFWLPRELWGTKIDYGGDISYACSIANFRLAFVLCDSDFFHPIREEKQKVTAQFMNNFSLHSASTFPCLINIHCILTRLWNLNVLKSQS